MHHAVRIAEPAVEAGQVEALERYIFQPNGMWAPIQVDAKRCGIIYNSCKFCAPVCRMGRASVGSAWSVWRDAEPGKIRAAALV
jgi:hypothetical protein